MTGESILRTGEYRGVTYRVGFRTPCPGIGWEVLNAQGKWVESQGAFYDGALDHPEGAVLWAENAVKRFIDWMQGDNHA